ncbi:hypothetical protein [Pajaroellobacter abortibovis]|uniref:Tetratricopeptide repeat protein n=1 Tax=Pajaroellobacter abortibovis TaxID=1882918 RepID=A0A1L6MVG5_9BACT|nr:hypothetical protein [Pajaroellobacter abortibovis]APR99491.1 hypothetical protein BCY86_01435 [Pajaroellobacter abortibovis]
MLQLLYWVGGNAREQGDRLGAAADYNRALAYAPDDPLPLRTVAQMHCAIRSLRRIQKIVISILVALIVLGGEMMS